MPRNAVNYCNLSEAQTLAGLASIASLSTVLTLAVTGDLSTYIDSYDPNADTELDADEKRALVASISNSETSVCNPETGAMKDNEFCQNIPDNPPNSSTASDAEIDSFVDQWIANNQQADNP